MELLRSAPDFARSATRRFPRPADHDFELITREHPARLALERFIGDGYLRAYGARVVHFADVLIGLSGASGQWVGGVGYTLAGREPLFVEQYVDQSIEEVVHRRDIVEVGNLFATGLGAARRIIVLMTELLYDLGRSWVVLTLTKSLLNSFVRLGIEPIPLIAADPWRLQDRGASWGTYYSHAPCVMTANIRSGFRRLVGEIRHFSY
jgi:hypothetical protein